MSKIHKEMNIEELVSKLDQALILFTKAWKDNTIALSKVSTEVIES